LGYSYEELLTVNTISTYDTFQHAVTKFGLFAYIAEAKLCLQEALSLYYALYHLHFLYTQLIVDISASALDLKNTYKDMLSANHV
jgi:hypothetical protein